MTPLLTNFSILRPEFIQSQSATQAWIAAAHARVLGFSDKHEEAAMLCEKLGSLGLGEGKIDERGTVMRDCHHQNWEEMEIFSISEAFPEGAHLDKRMALYDRVTSEVFERFYPDETPLSPHLIHVSCTGYVSPSGAQKIAAKRPSPTAVTHAYHMGCYGSIPALRMAMGHWHAENCPSDIVHTELCSLHMNPSLHSTEQLIVQSLFGDGFIKYSLMPSDRGFKVLALHEQLIPDSSTEMTWQCTNWGFYMTLAKEVPVSIRRNLNSFLDLLFKKAQRNIKEEIYFAIHPGGPKIIEQVVKLLQLQPKQYQHSQAILRGYGNMSSATLPHIWQSMLEDSTVPKGAQIASLAFGPGLTIAGALFEKI